MAAADCLWSKPSGIAFASIADVSGVNEPFDPAEGKLPWIYFSDHWHWEPNKPDLEPRRERWGGLLLALVGTVVYLQYKRAVLARNLALIGFIAGGLGFCLGQSVQATHAWNLEAIDRWLGPVAPHINWWNMMETTFGLIFGAGLGFGVWLNRRRLANADEVAGASDAASSVVSPIAEAVLLTLHVAALAAWNFCSYRPFDYFADLAVTMGVIPAVCVLAGRYSAYFVALPIVALPIAGKTLRQLSCNLNPPFIEPAQGWIVLFAMPLLVTTIAAWLLAMGQSSQSARHFARWVLLLTAWLYFWLNFAFFELPWPWQNATVRTPNAAIFFACAVLLTGLSLWSRRRK